MDSAVVRGLGLALFLAGCADGDADSAQLPVQTFAPPPELADRVLSAPGATGEGFGDSQRAVNGVYGGGPTQGSTDVFRLAIDGEAASLTLEWSAGSLVDEPGVDLVVYENPFDHPAGRFMDPVVVEVSADGQAWIAFPHDYLAADEAVWSSEPSDWVGFAGVTPVNLNEDSNQSDPLDPAVSGGDGFDLADVGLSAACCVRLWSASAWENPDSGLPFPRHAIGDGADIDGVYGRVGPSK